MTAKPSERWDQETYIERATYHAAVALLWQATDVSENGGSGFPIYESTPCGDDFYGQGADHIDAVQPLIVADVTQFVRDNWETLNTARVAAPQCGHDLILTANGHGAGFWDRGLGEAGRTLSDATKGYSFDAEFALAGDRRITGDYDADDLVWLIVENTVIVNETLQAWGDNWEASD